MVKTTEPVYKAKLEYKLAHTTSERIKKAVSEPKEIINFQE